MLSGCRSSFSDLSIARSGPLKRRHSWINSRDYPAKSSPSLILNDRRNRPIRTRSRRTTRSLKSIRSGTRSQAAQLAARPTKANRGTETKARTAPDAANDAISNNRTLAALAEAHKPRGIAQPVVRDVARTRGSHERQGLHVDMPGAREFEIALQTALQSGRKRVTARARRTDPSHGKVQSLPSCVGWRLAAGRGRWWHCKAAIAPGTDGLIASGEVRRSGRDGGGPAIERRVGICRRGLR